MTQAKQNKKLEKQQESTLYSKISSILHHCYSIHHLLEVGLTFRWQDFVINSAKHLYQVLEGTKSHSARTNWWSANIARISFLSCLPLFNSLMRCHKMPLLIRVGPKIVPCPLGHYPGRKWGNGACMSATTPFYFQHVIPH